MRQLARRLRLLAGFVAIGFGVLFGKSGSWAMSRYFQIAMPLHLAPTAAAYNATVTVIVPAHNEATRMADLVACVKAQTYPLFRCVIVDDASTDGTYEAAVAAIDADPRFDIIRLLRNSGLPAARNAGLIVTQTEFVVFLDADDFLTAEALGSRVERIRKDPSATGSFGHALNVVEGVNWRKQKTHTMDKAARRMTLTTSEGELPFLIHQVLMRTSAILEIGGFDETLDRGCEDTEFWFRSLRSGHEFVDTQARDCLYVQRKGSMIDSKTGHHVDTFLRLIQANLAGESPLPQVVTANRVDGPLPALMEQAVVQKRAFKSLGMMAAAIGDEVFPPAMNEALAAPRVISNATALAEMRLGVGRSINRAGVNNQRLVDEALAAAAHRYRDVFLTTIEPQALPAQNEPGWAILLCDAQQVNLVADALAGLSAHDGPTLLTADSLTHNHGATDALAADPKWHARSVVKYLLQGCVYEVVLISDHDCAASSLVESVARARGSRVVRWTADPVRDDVVNVADIAKLAVRLPAAGVPRALVREPIHGSVAELVSPAR